MELIRTYHVFDVLVIFGRPELFYLARGAAMLHCNSHSLKSITIVAAFYAQEAAPLVILVQLAYTVTK